MTPKRKAAPGQGNGSKVRQEESNNIFSGKVDASADERHAELLTRAARIIAHSIFSSRLTSPEVHAVEEGLRIVFEDAAAFHQWRGSHFRRDAGVLFNDRKAA